MDSDQDQEASGNLKLITFALVFSAIALAVLTYMTPKLMGVEFASTSNTTPPPVTGPSVAPAPAPPRCPVEGEEKYRLGYKLAMRVQFKLENSWAMISAIGNPKDHPDKFGHRHVLQLNKPPTGKNAIDDPHMLWDLYHMEGTAYVVCHPSLDLCWGVPVRHAGRKIQLRYTFAQAIKTRNAWFNFDRVTNTKHLGVVPGMTTFHPTCSIQKGNRAYKCASRGKMCTTDKIRSILGHDKWGPGKTVRVFYGDVHDGDSSNEWDGDLVNNQVSVCRHNPNHKTTRSGALGIPWTFRYRYNDRSWPLHDNTGFCFYHGDVHWDKTDHGTFFCDPDGGIGNKHVFTISMPGANGGRIFFGPEDGASDKSKIHAINEHGIYKANGSGGYKRGWWEIYGWRG